MDRRRLSLWKRNLYIVVKPYWTYLLRGLDGCCLFLDYIDLLWQKSFLKLVLSHSGEFFFQYIIRMCSDSPASSDIQDSLTLQHFSGRLGHKTIPNSRKQFSLYQKASRFWSTVTDLIKCLSTLKMIYTSKF